MARLLLVASLVGARGAAGLGAAPADSSMMQVGAAADKSNASQQTIVRIVEAFAPIVFQRDGKCLGVEFLD